MTNDELIKALKYISRKKTATRREINKHLNAKEDITHSPSFYDHTKKVSAPLDMGYYLAHPDETFKLSDEGYNLLAKHIKETKAERRSNLALLISFFALLIAAAALFKP